MSGEGPRTFSARSHPGTEAQLTIACADREIAVALGEGSLEGLLRLVGVADLASATAIAEEPTTERAFLGESGGVLRGLSLTSTRGAIAGAILEGVGFAAASALVEAEGGHDHGVVRLCGRLAIGAVAAVVADALGAPVRTAEAIWRPSVRARSRRARFGRWRETGSSRA